MRAFFIDPDAETVTEIDFEGDYKAIQQAIDCRTFDVVTICEKGSTLYLDDEGFMHAGKTAWCFASQPDRRYAGKGLVLGTTGEGDNAPVHEWLTLAMMQKLVQWTGLESTGQFTAPRETMSVHPMFGDQPIPTLHTGQPLLVPKGTHAAEMAEREKGAQR